MPERILLRNGRVISCDSNIGDLDGDVLVDGGEIVEIGRNVRADNCRVIDVSGCIILPGFVDAHSHLWEQSLRNVGVDWSLPDYHRRIRGTFGGLYRPEDIYAGNLLGAVEALRSGVTTVLDCSHNMNSPQHADAAVQALRDAGLRSVLAYGSGNDHWLTAEGRSQPLSDDARRVRSDLIPGDDGLLTMALCSRGAFGHPDVLAADVRMGRDLGVPITCPAGLPGAGGDVPGIDTLHRQGLTGPDLLYYHCSEPTEAELDVIADTGGRVAYTPENEMRMGYALPCIGRLMEHGVRPGLGVDTPVMSSDYFTAMRMMLAAEGVRQHLHELSAGGGAVQSLRLGVRDVIELATVAGAEACWLGERIGSLTPGKQADVIVIDKEALSLTPVYHHLGAVVYNGSPASVRTVMVAGELRKLEGEMVGVSVERVVELAEASRAHLYAQAGLSAYEDVR